MSEPCKTCQPMPTCREGLDRYSLQDENYLFVLNCPPGATCEGFGVIQLVCCDGTVLSVVLPEGILAEVRQGLLQGMLNEAGRRLPFCDPPPEYPETPIIPPPCPNDDCSPNPPPIDPGPQETDPGDPGGPGINLYWNRATIVTVNCPGGAGTFTYIFPAGRILAFSQAAADRQALIVANALARQNIMCLSALGTTICEGSAVTATVRVSGPASVHTWSLSGGSLPPGMTLADGVHSGKQTTISGTPTATGVYTFSIRAVAGNGLYAERSYTLCVVGIVEDTLPDGSLGTDYSETLTAPACAVPPLSFQVTAGALPDGLNLNEETGEISGTPTAAGTFNFTVTLQTEAT